MSIDDPVAVTVKTQEKMEKDEVENDIKSVKVQIEEVRADLVKINTSIENAETAIVNFVKKTDLKAVEVEAKNLQVEEKIEKLEAEIEEDRNNEVLIRRMKRLTILEDRLNNDKRLVTDEKKQLWDEKNQFMVKETQLRDKEKELMVQETQLMDWRYGMDGSTTRTTPSVVGVDVKWRESHSLFCDTSGKRWVYQSSDEIHEAIERGFEHHIVETQNNQASKNSHPMFLILSGPGTGKSRLLDEFPRLACDRCMSEELLAKLKGAYIFKVDMENGTRAFFNFWSPSIEIGCRMYYQLHPNSLDWGDFIRDTTSHIPPGAVLRKLAKAEKKELKDMTVIILLDGLQNLAHDAGCKSTPLYHALTELATLTNSSAKVNSPFVTCCVSATIEQPVQTWLGTSSQYREYLTPPKLVGSKVIDTEDMREIALVNNMGGHGRSLEILERVFKNDRAKDIGIARVEEKLLLLLRAAYPHWHQKAELAQEVLVAIMTGLTVERERKLSGYTVDSIEGLGFVTWNRDTHKLECPFVWLRLAAPELIKTLYADYFSDLDHYVDPDKHSKGRAYWQQWEDFTGRFFALKTTLLAGREMNWHKLHEGATFKQDGRCPKVTVKSLTINHASHQFPTNSVDLPDVIKTKSGTVYPRDCTAFVFSAYGNPGADSFCCVEESLSGGKKREVCFGLSNKLAKDKRSLEKYEEEWRKAVNEKDFFIEYGKHYSFGADELPSNRCGYVDLSNFQKYFGLFAGQAFVIWDMLAKKNEYAQS